MKMRQFLLLSSLVTLLVCFSCSDDVEDLPQYTKCPDGNHPHLIDLGLPSGTMWSCSNIGASSPEGYGGYFAWGETEEKSAYDMSTYKYFVLSPFKYVHIGEDIAGTKYDVARVSWGGSWRMPSFDQFEELCNCCTITWTTQNGVYGRLVTGKNGGTIFLPAAGGYLGPDSFRADEVGFYWMSSINQLDEGTAYCLAFDYSSCTWTTSGRYYGISVRAVCQ